MSVWIRDREDCRMRYPNCTTPITMEFVWGNENTLTLYDDGTFYIESEECLPQGILRSLLAALDLHLNPASRFVPGSDPTSANTTNQSGPVVPPSRPVPPSCFHDGGLGIVGGVCRRCGDEVEGVPV